MFIFVILGHQLHVDLNDKETNIGKLFINFMKNIQESEGGVDCCLQEAEELATIDNDALLQLSYELKDKGEEHAAIFIAHVCLLKATTATHLRDCSGIISVATEKMYIAGNKDVIKKMKGKLMETYRGAIKKINETADEHTTKVVCTASCLRYIGLLHFYTDDNNQYLATLEGAIEFMNTNLDNPQHFHVYAHCYFNKARSLENMGDTSGALAAFTAAKQCYNQCTDLSDADKGEWIRYCDNGIVRVQSK